MGSISSVCTKKRIIDVTSQRIFTEEEVIVLRRQWPVMMTNVDQNAVNLFMKYVFTHVFLCKQIKILTEI